MKRALFGLSILLSLAAVAQAEPLKVNRVAEKAQWVLHVDLDAFRETHLAEKIRREKLDKPGAKLLLQLAKERYGIDLQQGLHGLTLYGTSYRREDGVALLTADYDQKKVLGIVKKQPGYETEEHGKHTVHTWNVRGRYAAKAKDSDERGERDERQQKPRTMSAAFHEGVVVVGSDAKSVEHALDVLDGEKEHLDDDSPLSAESPPGTVFSGAADDLEELRNAGIRDPFGKLAILQQGRSVAVAIGESDDTAFYQLEFVARKREVADMLGQVIAGLQALLELQGRVDDDLAELAEGLEWDVDGKTVSIHWEADADDVLEFLERQRKMHRRWHDRWRHKHHDSDKDAKEKGVKGDKSEKGKAEQDDDEDDD